MTVSPTVDGVGIAFSLLRQNAGVIAIVQDRVTPFEARQGGSGKAPIASIVLYSAGGSPTQTLDGVGDPWKRRVTVECRGSTYEEAWTVGVAAMAAMNIPAGHVVDDQIIHACYPIEEQTPKDDLSGIVRRMIDYRITHSANT